MPLRQITIGTHRERDPYLLFLGFRPPSPGTFLPHFVFLRLSASKPETNVSRRLVVQHSRCFFGNSYSTPKIHPKTRDSTSPRFPVLGKEVPSSDGAPQHKSHCHCGNLPPVTFTTELGASDGRFSSVSKIPAIRMNLWFSD